MTAEPSRLGGKGHPDLIAGWAFFAFRGLRGHWYTRLREDQVAPEFPRLVRGQRARYYVSLCKPNSWALATDAVPPFFLGDMPPCKTCLGLAPYPPTARDHLTFLETP
jgi:hypothetical protein